MAGNRQHAAQLHPCFKSGPEPLADLHCYIFMRCSFTTVSRIFLRTRTTVHPILGNNPSSRASKQPQPVVVASSAHISGSPCVNMSLIDVVELGKRKRPLVLGTHSGSFHCDEALGMAMLQMISPELKVGRYR